MSSLEALEGHLERSHIGPTKRCAATPGWPSRIGTEPPRSSASALDEAIEAYRRATAIDDQDAGAWLALGRLLEKRQRWAEAANAYDRALAANPTRADAAMLAGLIYQRRLGDPARAVDLYRTVLRLVPTHYGAHYQIATALLAAGEATAARAAWRTFVPLAEAHGDRKSLDSAPPELAEESRTGEESKGRGVE